MPEFISDTDNWLDGESAPEVKQKPKTKKIVEKVVPTVVYVPVKCPRCREKRKIRWNGCYGMVRYHDCLSCGISFRSVEK